ncbi:MAG: Wzz/FepE/Etk N-terminal domain-containing protein [Gaiellaceae bacterium]
MNRRRLLAALVFVVLAAGVSVAYSFLAPKRYEATARVVVHPVPANDDTLTGVDVLRDNSDESRTLATAAGYFETPDVLRQAAITLGMSQSKLAGSIDVHPLSGANVLLIVGKASNATRAAQIANGVLQEGISERTARFQAQVGAALAKVRADTSAAAQRRALDLTQLQGRPDPTVELLSAATAPASASWPKPGRVIAVTTLAAALLAALGLLLPHAYRTPRRRALSVEQDGLLAEREHVLAERERVLAARERGLEQRQRELEQALRATEQATKEFARREREFAEHAAAVERLEADAAAEPDPVPVPETAPEPEPEPEAAAAAPEPEPPAAGWTIQALERLVAERGAEHPDRLEEWRYYIHFLREHAGPSGALPSSFDGLILDTFAELL